MLPHFRSFSYQSSSGKSNVWLQEEFFRDVHLYQEEMGGKRDLSAMPAALGEHSRKLHHDRLYLKKFLNEKMCIQRGSVS